MESKIRLAKACLFGMILALCAFACIACDEESVHVLTLVPEKAATCVETGNTAYYTCSHCDKLFTSADGTTETTLEAVTTAKLPHDFTGEDCHVAAKDFSCTEDGNEEYYRCKMCGNTFADAEGQYPSDPIIKARHTLTHYTYIAPTIDDFGRKEYWLCGVCGKSFVDGEGKTELTGDTQIAKLPEYDVEISVVVKDERGETVSDTGDVAITLVSAVKTYKGKIAGGKLVKEEVEASDEPKTTYAIGAGVYAVHARKDNVIFYDTEITIEDNAESAELTLVALDAEKVGKTTAECLTFTANADGSGKKISFIYPVGNFGENYVAARLTDTDAITGENYGVDFTVRVGGEYTGDWSTQFFIRATSAEGEFSGICAVLYAPATDDVTGVNIGRMWHTMLPSDHSCLAKEKADLFKEEASNGTLRLRLVRTGAQVKLYMRTENGYDLLTAQTISSGAEITFGATGTQTIEFSDIVTGKYVAQVNPGFEVPGKEAHFVQAGGSLYTLDGQNTTDAALAIDAITEQNAEITVTVYDKAGQPVSDTSEIAVDLQGAYKKYADLGIAEGKLNQAAYVYGAYTVTAKKTGTQYYTTELTLNGDTAQLHLYEVEHGFITANPNVDVSYVSFVAENTAVGKKKVIFNPTSINAADATFALFQPMASQPTGQDAQTWGDKIYASNRLTMEFTLKIEGDYSTDWLQRFSVGMADEWGTCGVGLIFYKDGINAGWFYPHCVPGDDHAAIAADTTTAFKNAAADGSLRLRAVREGATVTLSMQSSNGWVTLASRADAAGNGRITLCTNGSLTYTVSDWNVTVGENA